MAGAGFTGTDGLPSVPAESSKSTIRRELDSPTNPEGRAKIVTGLTPRPRLTHRAARRLVSKEIKESVNVNARG